MKSKKEKTLREEQQEEKKDKKRNLEIEEENLKENEEEETDEKNLEEEWTEEETREEEIRKEETPVVKVRRTGFNSLEVAIMITITLLLGLVVGGIVSYVRLDTKGVSYSAVRKDLAEFMEVYDDISNEYYSEVDRTSLLEAAIQGMVEYLADPYSMYLEEEDAEGLSEDLSGTFMGIGVQLLGYDYSYPVIYHVFENSSASRSGIREGDILYKVDGLDMKELTMDEMTNRVKNLEKGETISVVMKRDDQELEFELVKELIVIPSAVSRVVTYSNHKVGVITISSFAKNTLEQFEKAYKDLQKEEVEALIIDLRDNSGGYLSITSDILSKFMKKEEVMYQSITKDGVETVKATKDGEIVLPVAVLTNNDTASSSEVFTAAMKENNRAYIVGRRTYGKGTVQKLHQLSSGSYIKYTIQIWLTPSGKDINGAGIDPTHEVILNDEYYENPVDENDNQLMEALKLLTQEENEEGKEEEANE